jgi:tetratricopeptide (TPR) repeat protein
MDQSKQEPEGIPKSPKATDEDTFLFMGTRISLGSGAAKPTSEPDLNATVPGSQPATPATSPPERTTASPESARESVEGPSPAKSSFDLDPFAASSKPAFSGRIFLAGAALLLIALAAFMAWHRFGSLEARILRAANSGQLIRPEGSSAYDLYQLLKAEDLSPVTREKLKREVLPKLSEEGNTLLKKRYEGSDLAEAEIDRLMRIYEWAADLDPLDRSILARRAYANGCRALFKKADGEALSAFREAIQNDSQWPLPFSDLARLQASAGDYDSADYFYRQAVLLDPKWALPRLQLAGLYLERNRLAEAELAYRGLAEADPTLAAPWYFLGQLYERQRRKVEAIAAYERALRLAEQRPSSTFMVEETRSHLERIR